MSEELVITEEPLSGSIGGGKVFRGTGPHAAVKKWFMGLIKEAKHGTYAAYTRQDEGRSEGIVCAYGEGDSHTGIIPEGISFGRKN